MIDPKTLKPGDYGLMKVPFSVNRIGGILEIDTPISDRNLIIRDIEYLGLVIDYVDNDQDEMK